MQTYLQIYLNSFSVGYLFFDFQPSPAVLPLPVLPPTAGWSPPGPGRPSPTATTQSTNASRGTGNGRRPMTQIHSFMEVSY